MSPDDAMRRIDGLLSHVWMVRTFLKHADEAEDPEVQEIYRELYDFILALGKPWEDKDAAAYLKQAGKKYARLRTATEKFAEIQPNVSAHTNFQMAARSLSLAAGEIGEILGAAGHPKPPDLS
jgi:hypothetical protein